jgi:lipid-A-disaccharide synthase
MDRVCDSIVAIFPFERAFYEARGCKKVTYVGHPFTGAAEYQQLTQEERDAARLALGVTPCECLLVCFLGSRKKEVTAHLDFSKEVIERLTRGRPHLRVHIVSPRAEWQEWLESEFTAFSQVKITVGDSVKMLQTADVGLIKSGTSNLQAVFAGLPFVMYYRVARITGLIARVFIKGVKSFSIVNIIKPGTITEIVGEELSVDAATKALERLIDSPEAREALKVRYQEIVTELRTFDPLPEVKEPSTPFSRAAHVILNCAHHE